MTNSQLGTIEIKPRLKIGVIVTAVSGTKPQLLFIGHASAGIQISHPGAAAIVANFVGLLTCFEISIQTGAPFEVVTKICDACDKPASSLWVDCVEKINDFFARGRSLPMACMSL